MIIAVGLAPTAALAAGLMVVVGVCGAFVSPTTMALVTDIVPASERGAAMGRLQCVRQPGMLSGFLVGGIIADLYGYLPAFLAAGGLEIAIAVPRLEWSGESVRSGTTLHWVSSSGERSRSKGSRKEKAYC